MINTEQTEQSENPKGHTEDDGLTKFEMMPEVQAGITIRYLPESRYFCRKIFSGILLEKIGKNHATAYAFGAPIRPRHLVPTQQGVGTLVLA